MCINSVCTPEGCQCHENFFKFSENECRKNCSEGFTWIHDSCEDDRYLLENIDDVEAEETTITSSTDNHDYKEPEEDDEDDDKDEDKDGDESDDDEYEEMTTANYKIFGKHNHSKTTKSVLPQADPTTTSNTQITSDRFARL